ncbi:hypothetical protein F6Y05_37065 [Bacillus megaterium]|nr:hypothetical protein [Priestia megaterium]
MNHNSKELSDFVKQQLEELKPYEDSPIKFPLGDYSFDFWALDAESVFPNSPDLQKTFNRLKKKKPKRLLNFKENEDIF